MTTDLMRLNDAARAFGINPRTLRRRIDDGTVPGYRLGPRLIYVKVDELRANLQGVQRKSGK